MLFLQALLAISRKHRSRWQQDSHKNKLADMGLNPDFDIKDSFQYLP